MRFIACGVLGIVALAEVWLLATDHRVLVTERRINEGQVAEIPEYGAVAGDSLACAYFTGRSTIWRVYAYSPNNLFGRDSCENLLSAKD